VQDDALVELWIGLALIDLDGVTESHQLTTQMAEVDALTAAVWLAAVRHECDAHGRPP